MLNADDPYTLAALQRLKEAIRQKRPLVLWIGAGASRWAGIPSWHESARQMRRAFVKCVPELSDELAKSLISSKAYPEFFQLCRDADSNLYHKILAEQFTSPKIGPLYEQFIAKVRQINPAQIVTTNIDLCLEQNLEISDVIEKTDLERCCDRLVGGASFIAKLHGSVSAVDSTIFTTADYASLAKGSKYMTSVKSIFSLASVIFLGYSLQDEYLLKMITENEADHALFGNGPHFLVTESPGPPERGVYRIGYRINQHGDHRAALTVLDFAQQAKSIPVAEVLSGPKTPCDTVEESGFYISDFKPSGTHISGQVLELGNLLNESKISAITGLGFVDGELLSSDTVAFHDLAVGLLCFDRVFLPLHSVGLLHQRTTAEVFWPLIDSGAIKFVDLVHDPFFVSTPESLMGDIGIARIQNIRQEESRSSMSVIRKMLKAVPGREEEGEKRIEGLEKYVEWFPYSEKLGLPAMVRSTLLLPHVSQLLGFSESIVPSSIPRWLAYPTLRLAHLVQTSLVCDQLHIRASRVPFGGTSLLSAAFSVKAAEQSVYDYASYVMTGTFGSNLSQFIERDPKSLLSIVPFRESAEGEALRREMSSRLETNEGTEFSSAIEGGLRRAIPNVLIQAARNKFSTLLKSGNPNASAAVLWSNNGTDDNSLQRWRDRSRELLWLHAKNRGVKSDSSCMCGSGDRLRDCCLRPLQ